MYTDAEMMAEAVEMFNKGDISVAEMWDYVDNFDGDIVDFL